MAAVRVLLVHGSDPSGHATAAFALEEAARARGLIVSRVSVSGDHHPLLASAVAAGYHELLRAAPGLVRALYRGRAARTAIAGVRRAYLRLGGGRRLREGVERAGADVVLCPQASVAAVFAEARRMGFLRVPLLGVLTDWAPNPFWASPPADLVLAPDEASARALAAAGVPAERILASGIPVLPVFSAPLERESARRTLGLPASAPVVLLSGGSRGLGQLDEAARALLAASPRARMLAFCGANDRLRRALSGAGERLRVFGPQPPAMVALALAASDVHVGKPGGLSCAESLAAGVPLVLLPPLGGPEEENARALESRGAALGSRGGAEAGRTAALLLEDAPALAAMRARARRAARPGAAPAAIEAALRLAAAALRT